MAQCRSVPRPTPLARPRSFPSAATARTIDPVRRLRAPLSLVVLAGAIGLPIGAPTAARAFMRPGQAPIVSPVGRWRLRAEGYAPATLTITADGELYHLDYAAPDRVTASGLGLVRDRHLFASIDAGGFTLYRVAPDGGARGVWSGPGWAAALGEVEVDPAVSLIHPDVPFVGVHRWRSRMPGSAGGFVDSPHVFVVGPYSEPLAGVRGMPLLWGTMLSGAGLQVGSSVVAAWGPRRSVATAVTYDFASSPPIGVRMSTVDPEPRTERLERLP